MAASTNFCGSDVVGVATPRTLDNSRKKEKAKELILVEWVDIISDDGWVVAEDCELPTFYSVGWLEYQDEKVLNNQLLLHLSQLLWHEFPLIDLIKF